MKFERGYAQHLGSRQEQQDAGILLSDEARNEQLVVVADGMGGHAGGSIASAQVAETAKRLWAEHLKTPIEPKRLLERIVREGHEAINRAGAEKGLTPRSTCALLFVRNSQAYWAHVGDSRIYRLRDSHLTRLTRDHSVVQMLVDLGKVSEEEMGTHPDQNRLTQSLGGEAAPMPDFGSDGVQPHDAFLICSDGLWEMIPQPEMVSALAAKKLGDDSAKHMADRAFDRAKPRSDNITVALLRIGGPPPNAVASIDSAVTTRLPPSANRSSGGAARWGFAAATVVAIAAAAVIIKPWEPKAPDSTAVGTTPKGTPEVGTSPAPQEPRKEAPKQDAEPQPAERRAAPPPPVQPPPPQPPSPPAQPPQAQPPQAQPPQAQPPGAQPAPTPPSSTPPSAAPPSAPPPPGTPPSGTQPGQPPAAQPPAPPATPAPAQPGTPPTDGSSGAPDNQRQPGQPPSSGERGTPSPPDARKQDGELQGNPGRTPPASGPNQPSAPPPVQQ